MAGMKLVVSGPTESKAVRLDAKGVTLGRGSNCDIVLDHTNVSRVHARISQDPFGRWIVACLSGGEIGKIIRELCRQKGIELVEGKAMPDHVHMLLSVPPRFSIAMTVGYLKGKSAIRIHRDVSKVKGTLFGRSFWARGYCVSTVGLDESTIRQYIQDQEQRQQNQEQGELNFM